MKKNREVQLVMDAFRDAGCEITDTVRCAVSHGLKQIRIEKHEERKRQAGQTCRRPANSTKGGENMNCPKLVIATDGYATAALLDGVLIGPGIEKLEFLADGGESKIRIMDLDVKHASLSGGAEKFTKFMEKLAEND